MKLKMNSLSLMQKKRGSQLKDKGKRVAWVVFIRILSIHRAKLHLLKLEQCCKKIKGQDGK